MTLATLINRPCTLVRRRNSGETDEYGDPIEDEDLLETLCELQQRERTEPGAAGEFSETLWLLFLPAGTELGTADAVIVDGETYEMVGDPWHARNPRTMAESHVEATVRRTGAEVGS